MSCHIHERNINFERKWKELSVFQCTMSIHLSHSGLQPFSVLYLRFMYDIYFFSRYIPLTSTPLNLIINAKEVHVWHPSNGTQILLLPAVEMVFALVAARRAAAPHRCRVGKSRRSKKGKVEPCRRIRPTRRDSSWQSWEQLPWCQLWIRSLWDSNVSPLGIQCKQYKEDDFKCSKGPVGPTGSFFCFFFPYPPGSVLCSSANTWTHTAAQTHWRPYWHMQTFCSIQFLCNLPKKHRAGRREQVTAHPIYPKNINFHWL